MLEVLLYVDEELAIMCGGFAVFGYALRSWFRRKTRHNEKVKVKKQNLKKNDFWVVGYLLVDSQNKTDLFLRLNLLHVQFYQPVIGWSKGKQTGTCSRTQGTVHRVSAVILRQPVSNFL